MDGVVAVSPAFDIGGEVKWGRKRGHFMVIGIDQSLMGELEFEVSAGRLLNETDRFNIVAGSQVINNFWEERQMNQNDWEERPQGDPLDMLNQRFSMTVYNAQQQKRMYNLNVVGILSEKNMDRAWEVYAPLSEVRKIRDFINRGSQQDTPIYMEQKTAVSSRTGNQPARKQEEQYSFALIRTRDVGDTRRISKELREMGFNAYSLADSLEGIEETARRLQAILGGIGAITLLVAAIGITNTMVMSIYERTREIAIMKVIGASFTQIRWLFLSESSLIGLMGGILGIGFSYFLSSLLNKYGAAFLNPGGGMAGPGNPMQISMIPPWLVLFAVLFSLAIGLVSGLYPANRAIHLDPINAMRHG